MAVESKMTMQFDAQAESVERAYDDMGDGAKQMTRVTIDGMTKAAAAIKLVTDQLMENNVATKALVEEHDRLKTKMAELKQKNEEFGQSIDSVKTIFQGLTAAFAGGEIVNFIRQYLDATKDWNKEIVQTQVEMDKVARQFQVMALMKDKDFQETYDKQIVPMANELGVSVKNTALPALIGAKEMGVKDQDLLGVVRQGILSSMASGVGEAGAPEFTESLLQKAQREGRPLTQDELLASSLPLINARKQMGISGQKLVMAQRRAAELQAEHETPEDVTLAELVTLGRTGPGGMDSRRAMMALTSISTRLNSIPTKARDILGEDLADALQKKSAEGNQLGAFAQLAGSFQAKGLGKEKQAEVLDALFGRKLGSQASILVNNVPFIMNTLDSFKDQATYQEAAGIAGQGAARRGVITENLQEQTKYNQQTLAEKNKRVLETLEAELGKEKYGMSAWRRNLVLKGDGLPMGLGSLGMFGSLQTVASSGGDLEKEIERISQSDVEGGEHENAFSSYYGDPAAYRAALATYRKTVGKGLTVGAVPNLPVGAVPPLGTANIPTAFQRSPEDMEIDSLKAQLLQAQQQVVDFEKGMHNPRIPINQQQNLQGFKGFEDEKQHLHELKEIKGHLAELIEVAKGKKEQRLKAKNGLNL